MSDSRVISLVSGNNIVAGAVNDRLVEALEALLNMAKTGQLSSYIGTGFTTDGLRVATWCDFHEDIYQTMGSLAWLQHEYVERHPA